MDLIIKQQQQKRVWLTSAVKSQPSSSNHSEASLRAWLIFSLSSSVDSSTPSSLDSFSCMSYMCDSSKFFARSLATLASSRACKSWSLWKQTKQERPVWGPFCLDFQLTLQFSKANIELWPAFCLRRKPSVTRPSTELALRELTKSRKDVWMLFLLQQKLISQWTTLKKNSFLRWKITKQKTISLKYRLMVTIKEDWHGFRTNASHTF